MRDRICGGRRLRNRLRRRRGSRLVHCLRRTRAHRRSSTSRGPTAEVAILWISKSASRSRFGRFLQELEVKGTLCPGPMNAYTRATGSTTCPSHPLYGATCTAAYPAHHAHPHAAQRARTIRASGNPIHADVIDVTCAMSPARRLLPQKPLHAFPGDAMAPSSELLL